MQLYIQQREQLEKEKAAAQMRLDQLDAEVFEQVDAFVLWDRYVILLGTN